MTIIKGDSREVVLVGSPALVRGDGPRRKPVVTCRHEIKGKCRFCADSVDDR